MGTMNYIPNLISHDTLNIFTRRNCERNRSTLRSQEAWCGVHRLWRRLYGCGGTNAIARLLDIRSEDTQGPGHRTAGGGAGLLSYGLHLWGLHWTNWQQQVWGLCLALDLPPLLWVPWM